MGLHNLASMTTPTIGTGVITLGSATTGALTFAAAGVVNGETVSYAIRDGNNTECGTGVYSSAGTTLTRSPVNSSSGGAPINLSGSAVVFLVTLASDVVTPALLAGGTLPIGASNIVESYSKLVPTTGFAITLAARRTILNPAATLAAGTITMPPTPVDGQVCTVTSTKQVTALTVSPNSGQAVVCAPTFLSAGTPFSMLFQASSNTWFPT